MGRLDGKIALVTGAARGIGSACAKRFAEEGADLALVDIARDVETVAYRGAAADELAETCAVVRGLGRRASAYQCDVRDGEVMQRVASQVVGEYGRIDILVAAAGIDSRGQAWEITETQWQTMLDVNLTGVWHAAKAITPHMIEQQSGAIVFIGSVLSHKHSPGAAHYTAAKHGVLGLTKAFGFELAPYRIRVNSVAPTAVATEMALRQTLVAEAGVPADESLEARLLRWNTMPIAMVEPVDVANAVLFLASDEARFITGVSLPVDLGALLR
jgi:SDR family mycofactocin-dependent oxidoreductase